VIDAGWAKAMVCENAKATNKPAAQIPR